jgi:hypothetical protein
VIVNHRVHIVVAGAVSRVRPGPASVNLPSSDHGFRPIYFASTCTSSPGRSRPYRRCVTLNLHCSTPCHRVKFTESRDPLTA